LEEADSAAGATLLAREAALNAKGLPSVPVGRTPWVLLRDDRACAYPVLEDVPVLLSPEALHPASRRTAVDLTGPTHAEAYEEMDFYNAEARRQAVDIARVGAPADMIPLHHVGQADREAFPDPRDLWVDAVYDGPAQWDAYRHLGQVRGRALLQLGGKGSHAVKFLLAGAAEAWLVTPMHGEALFARALADSFQVGERLRCVVAVAEELPLRDGTVDGAYAGGCLHHMRTALALAEVARVLRPGGTFAAVEPWRAPLYGLGTRLLGKREPSVYCRPLTSSRVAPLNQTFSWARVVHHGALTRYALLGLGKLGIPCGPRLARRVNDVDDAVASLVRLRALGSSVAVLARK
jgi:SAM-dependent methyltransferase